MGGPRFDYVRGGLHLPGWRLWLDAHDAVGAGEAVVVTHAHSDHTAAHAEVILTEPTRRLMQARLGGSRVEHVLGYGERVDLGSARFGGGRDGHLTLLAAGHVLGSAMVRLEGEGGSLLYTGDFKLRTGLSSEPCQPCAADVLVMETTFGRPRYAFPPTASVLAGIQRFCREAIDNDEVPILLGYSLGKAQELLSGLGEAGLPVMLAEPVARLTRIYGELGLLFPEHRTLDVRSAAGHVVIAPPGAGLASLRRRIGPSRVAVLTGWAMDPGCPFRYQADAAFPLSDHADYPDLLELVRRVRPRTVYTLHGFAADFAADLRAEGYEAWALSEVEQLELGLGPRRAAVVAPGSEAKEPVVEQPAAPADARATAPCGMDGFGGFAATCAAVREVRSKQEKVGRVAGYLTGLGEEELGIVVHWFSGLAFGPADGRVPGVGGALLREAVCGIAGVTEADYRQVYLKHSDTGETAAELCRGVGAGAAWPTIAEVQGLFGLLAATRETAVRRGALQTMLGRCGPEGIRYLVKILTGNLRIGLKEGLVEEAVAKAYGVEAEVLRRGTLLLGDLGLAARRARSGALDGVEVEPLRPLKVMLASPEPDAASVWKRVEAWSGSGPGGARAWVEHKYDGVRCQAHRVGGEVRLWSRDQKELTEAFPELVAALGRLETDVVLDGEIVAMEGERVRPFADLQRRLGRREGDLFLGGEIAVRLVVFDLLWEGGRGWTERPLRERRARLEGMRWVEGVRLGWGGWVDAETGLDAAFAGARGAGNEGLMIKDPASGYVPGRRGISWLKWKQALATLDCVIVAAETGHGRRKSVLSDYTFAVRDGAGGLRVVGKAYSGLTDAEIAGLTERLLGMVTRQRGRVHEVRPEVVLEVAFDRVQASDRHDSGVALRFPRIVRLRPDKGVDEIDTLETVRRLMG